MRIELFNKLSCFAPSTIGTKVTNRTRFMQLLEACVAEHDFTAEDRGSGVVKGQGFIWMSREAVDTLTSGVGKHTHEPEDYVVRKHRGRSQMFLKRGHATPTDAVAAIVYTRDAYLKDPDVLQDTEEVQRITDSDCTHVLIAVLAFAGPKPPAGYERFVKNLAGGNKAYKPENTTLEVVIKEATAVVEYHDTWSVVAD